MNTFSKKKYFLLYTILFAVMALLVYYPFHLTGKSFVWDADSRDGLVQHYNALMFYGKALRETARALLREHRLILPEYSFSLGMGADVLKTLHYYVIGDPLNLLAAIVPSAKIYFLYCALIIVRGYLAGISFSILAIGRRIKNIPAILSGSMVYVFCGYALAGGVKHPYFVTPMIYLPLIILGVHIYLEKRRPFLYMISAAAAALSNFYFLYMIAIVTAVYILLTLIETYRNDIRGFVKSAAGLILSSLLAAAMSCVILLPVLTGFISDSRTQGGPLIQSHYLLSYYRSLPAEFTAYGYIGEWTYMSYGLLTLAAVFLLFRKKGNVRLKILFLIGIICMLVPYAGHVMNGFSYAVNRWCFAFSLLCAFILVRMWQDLFCMNRKDRMAMILFLIAYICFAFIIKPTNRVPAFGMICAIGMGGILILFTAEREKERPSAAYIQWLTALTVFLSVLGNAHYCYHPNQSDYLNEFSEMEYMSKIAHSRYPDLTVLKLQKKNGETILSRYSGTGFMRNSSLRYGTSTTQFFWSLSNPYVAKMRTDLLLSEDKPQAYTGFDDSTILNELAGVAYHVTNDYDLVPYGYEEAGQVRKNKIYHNQFALPPVYAYDSYMTHKEYDSLTPVQKTEAMLQGVLLETEEPELERTEPVLTSYEVPYEISSSGGDVVFYDNSFVAMKGNASIKLLVSGEAETETIFHVDNIRYQGFPELDLYKDDLSVDPENRYGAEEYDELDSLEKWKLKKAAKEYEAAKLLVLDFGIQRQDGSEITKKIQFATPYYQWYTGREDYTLNFGWSTSPVKEVTIRFRQRGIYRFDDLGFTVQPLGTYNEQVERLAKNAASDISCGQNSLDAKIHLDKTSAVCIAIPFDEGWTAYVDGEKARLQQANTAFMGLIMQEGDHEIRLVYKTPFLRAGAGITAAAWILYLCLIPLFVHREKRKGAD